MGFPEIHLDYQYTINKLEQLHELEIENLQKVIDILASDLAIANLENTRYREALQVYADDDVIGTVARKALKDAE